MINEPIKRRCVRAAACLALSLAGSAAGGTTIERLSLEKMVQAAPVIVRAECVGKTTVRDAGEIWTLSLFRVEQTWRGKAPATITVRLLGGSWGQITSHVSGVPQFRLGDDVVLFLQPTKRGDFAVVSWQQGTFRVRREVGGELVTQGTARFPTFDPATRQFRAAGIRYMPIEKFHAQVEAVLQSPADRQP